MKLIIISAPSGAGKTSIIKYLLSTDLNLAFSISATSRKPRTTEKHGVDYYFIEYEEFKKKIINEEFIEWEEVYEGVCYGTLKSEIERLTSQGKNVIFDVDVVGGLNIKKIYGTSALAVFIEPPSIKELERRLTLRNTDSPETISKRIAKAKYEMTFAKNYDVIIVNDDLQRACSDMENNILNFLYGKK